MYTRGEPATRGASVRLRTATRNYKRAIITPVSIWPNSATVKRMSPILPLTKALLLLNQQWPTDTMRTLTLSLPLLNPFDSMCDSRQDEDGVNCVPTRPLNQKSKNARKREKQQAKKQAAQQRSEPAHDPRFMDTSNKIHTHTRRRLCSGRCAHGG
jgi:hypothetical protein